MPTDVVWLPGPVAHMWLRHRITPDEANEAIRDREVVLRSPDPASRSRRSDRYIGWSWTRSEVLLVKHEGQWFGVNAWPANLSNRRQYEQRQES